MEWNNPDLARSVLSLIAKNNGFFKSAKQRQFLDRQMSSWHVHTFDRAEFVKSNYGVDIKEGQFMYVLEGDIRFADYGRKSRRRIAFALVYDEFGFVSKNKLHFSYSSDGGASSVNAEKTEVDLWVRDTKVPLPVFEVAETKDAPLSNHIGAVGEFIETTVTVKSIRAVGQGYYGTTYQTRMIDEDGNIIIYWGIMKNTSVCDGEFKIKLRAKVKEHGEYKGVNQTIVGYAKIKEVL